MMEVQHRLTELMRLYLNLDIGWEPESIVPSDTNTTLSDWWTGCKSLIYFGEEAARLAPDPSQIAMPDDDFRSRVAGGSSSSRPRLIGAYFPGKWITRATLADAVNQLRLRQPWEKLIKALFRTGNKYERRMVDSYRRHNQPRIQEATIDTY